MSIKKFFRCTPEENIIIVTNAADAGLEPSSYMRIQSIGKSKVRRYRRVRADWDELRRLMGAINKAGNVVNQFVRMVQAFGGSSALASKAFTPTAAPPRIWATIMLPTRKLKSNLGKNLSCAR